MSRFALSLWIVAGLGFIVYAWNLLFGNPDIFTLPFTFPIPASFRVPW